MNKIIYLDNAASTKVDEKVLKAMLPYFSKEYANASSKHEAGQRVRDAVESSREIIAKKINAKSNELIFTSGGTESNNLALKGLFFYNKQAKTGKNHIITTKIEHDSILETCKWLEEQGAEITYLNVKKQNLNLTTINSHKIHGPKGIGALYIREGIKIIPLIHGGGHEFQKRSGTENVPGIIGFAEAVKISDKNEINKIRNLRDKLISEILKIPNTKLNGATKENRLCNNINVSFSDFESEAIMAYLEKYKIYVSVGSACQSHLNKSSHVLKAIELKENEMNGVIRVSISKYTTKKEINYFLEKIKKIIYKLKKINL